MAEFIESNPSMGETTLPTNAGTLIRTEEWGIDNVLSNCIIQTENITESRMTDDTLDQKGSLVSQLDYDARWDLNLTFIGDSAKLPVTGDSSGIAVGDMTFEYAGKKWKITSVAYTGTYNGKKQYTLTAFRTKHFPLQGA